MVFNASQFSMSKDGTLVSEASDLQIVVPIEFITVVDGAERRAFRRVGVDANDGDVMGWRYRELAKAANLLIIND